MPFYKITLFFNNYHVYKNLEVQICLKKQEHAKNILEPQIFQKLRTIQAELGKLRTIWVDMAKFEKFVRNYVAILCHKHENFKNFLQIVLII